MRSVALPSPPPGRRRTRTAWLAIGVALLAGAGTGLPALAQVAPVAGNSASVSAAQAFTRGAPVPAWVERISTLPAAATGYPFTIRLDDTWFRAGDELAVYHHHAASVHEASRLGDLGQFDIEFEPAYQRLELHRLVVLRDGRAIDQLQSADIRFMQRERGLEQAMVNGTVTAQIVSTDIRVGDTLDIEFSIVGSNPVFGRHVAQSTLWDRAAPVGLRRVTIDSPAAAPVAHRLMGVTASSPQPRVLLRDGRRLVQLEEAGLPALVGEHSVPFDVHQFRWLQLSDFADWAAVNAWAQELFATRTAPAVLEAPLRAARAAATREQAVAKVLEFVQNDIRYLSLALGEHSHRPFAPETTLERRYGDCKDKTLLAVTMLRALGFEAAPVLVASYTTASLSEMLPSPLVFNHAIVMVVVDGEQHFLDPTRRGQYGALDRMGQVHGGRQVLVVQPGTTGLRTIPRSSGEVVTSRRFEQIALPTLDGPANLVVRTELAGIAAENARVYLATARREDLRKAHEGALIARYPDARLLDDPRVTDDRQHNRLSIEERYSIASLLGENDGGGYRLPFQAANLSYLFLSSGMAQRSHPLALSAFPGTYEYDLQVTLPPAIAYRDMVTEKKVDDAAFRLQRRLAVGKNSVRLNLQLVTLDDRVAAQRVPAYLKHVKQYDDLTSGAVVVPAPTTAPLGAP